MKRFFDKIKRSADCWEWTAGKDKNGYGVFKFKGKNQKAHRISYELFKKKIQKGKVIDHLCRNSGCVNPHHLEVVSQKENIRRGMAPAAHNMRLTHCRRGHEFTKENIYKRKDNRRHCRTCGAERSKKQREKNHDGTSATQVPSQ